MAYRAPSVRAEFVRTNPGIVANAGDSRIMALIGTGINYYNVVNETVQKQSDRAYDELNNSNVFEISSISSAPIYSSRNNPETVIYQPMTYDESGNYITGDYELKDGKYIVWRTLSDTVPEPKLVNVDTDPYINEGSRAFSSRCTYYVDVNNSHFVIDGQWRIEVTFASQTDGCYRIINVDTNETVGEYVCGSDVNTDIPGINLTVSSTYKLPETSDVDSDDNLIQAGDYFIIETTAAKTEQEASVAIESASSVAGLRGSVKSINIINAGRVVDGTYRLIIRDASTLEFQVVQIDSSSGSNTEKVIYPDENNSDANATWIEGDEVYDIIPGVEIILSKMNYTPNTGDFITINTAARITSDGIPGEGDSYYVSYKYRKSDDGYSPQYFDDYKSIVEEYGSYEVTASGFVRNSLSLGAEIAFANGIGQIICVQALGNSDAEFCNAIDKLKASVYGIENVNTIIPLTTSAAVGSYCSTHVTTMSSADYGKERMCYLGAYIGQPVSKSPTAADRSLGIIETCQGYNNERVVYVVPGRAFKSVKDPNTGKYNTRPLHGCYLAVAVAALGLVNDPAEPFTNKTITGFSYLPDVYTDNQMNLMAGAGACVLYNRGANIYVRHGLTTDMSDVNSQEITCIQIKDYVIEAVRSACASLYIGLKNTNTVVGNISYTINSILSQFVNATIIESFTGVSVSRSSTDPRQIDVSFEILPIYAVDYISITFSFSSL